MLSAGLTARQVVLRFPSLPLNLRRYRYFPTGVGNHKNATAKEVPQEALQLPPHGLLKAACDYFPYVTFLFFIL
jgi:hypothetical protein